MLQVVGKLTPSTSEEAVNALEQILARARNGEIVQVAIAYVTDAGYTGNTYGAHKGQHMGLMLGSIDMMHLRITQAAIEE